MNIPSRALWLLTFLVILAGRAVYVLEPHAISVDESTYLAIAEAWDHYGTLYVDAVDRKPPLLYGLYWLIGKVFGFWNIHGPHLVFIGFALVLCWLADQLARSVEPRLPGGWAALLFALISATFSREFIAANSELALLVPLGSAYFVLLRKPNNLYRFWPWLSAFSLALVASLIKQTGCLPILFSAASVFFLQIYRKEWKVAGKVFAAGIISLVMVLAPLFFVFQLFGNWNDMIYWMFLENISYIQESQHSAAARPILSPFFISIGAWPLFWAGQIFFLKDRTAWRPEVTALSAAVLGSLVFVSVGGRLYSHYFLPLAFFLVPLSSIAIYRWSQSRPRIVATLLLLPFLICFFLNTFREEFMSIVRPGKPSHNFSKAAVERIWLASQKVKAMTSSDDRIAVWGMASQFYVLSERGSATRFIFADYVSGRLAGLASGLDYPSKENLRLYLDDLEKKKPKVFVDTSTAGLNDYQLFPLRKYPELLSYLEKNYEKSGEVQAFTLWVRKN